jgi:NADH-quinone oxidoreductase subunit L
MEQLINLIPLFPLVGFLINGFGSGIIPKTAAGIIGSLAALISFVLSVLALTSFMKAGQVPVETHLWTWISSGNWEVDFSFFADQLTFCMLMVVTGVGFLIHIFSIGYMHHDEGFGKFFAFLNLFLFSMLVLVLGGNLLMTFIGWEGVGLCSFLLIGFWNKNDAYNAAAKKAFVMNRIGDLGFLIGIFILMFRIGSVQYTSLVEMLGNEQALNDPFMVAAALCLFVGAMGKSAQLPLFTWLPDAMAGPTPVSALIHAATMVTSGIYLLIRMNVLYSSVPMVQEFVMWIGLATAIIGALIGTSQNDIKKVLAYSTVSQLGFMFVALGVGAYTAALFHVITHAFFKALLFLGAGSVIHGLHEEQDIRRMGGLRKLLPLTYFTFMVANLAIAGVPPFSGFFSKDEILVHTFVHNKIAWGLLTLTAGITAFYMFRLFFLVFFNDYRGKLAAEKIHDAPPSMAIPLSVLAVLSLVGGFIGLPEVFHMPHYLAEFLQPVLMPGQVMSQLAQSAHKVSHADEWLVMGISVAVSLAGILTAWILYMSKKVVPADEASLNPMGRFFAGKFFIDELYDLIVVKPISLIASLFSVLVDLLMINLLVEGIGAFSRLGASALRLTQNGRVSAYVLSMLVFLLVFALVFIFRIA